MPRAPVTISMGEVFNNWTVIGPGQKPGKKSLGRHTTSLCKCSCGVTRFVKNSSLVNRRSESCGHVGKFQRGVSPRRKLPRGVAARNAALYHIKHGAVLRKQEFLLSDAETLSLMEKPCYWCGEIGVNLYSEKSYNGCFRYNGIDRLNNDLGYIASNVVSCCGPCNRTKNIFGKEEFIAFCVKIAVKHGKHLLGREGYPYSSLDP